MKRHQSIKTKHKWWTSLYQKPWIRRKLMLKIPPKLSNQMRAVHFQKSNWLEIKIKPSLKRSTKYLSTKLKSYKNHRIRVHRIRNKRKRLKKHPKNKLIRNLRKFMKNHYWKIKLSLKKRSKKNHCIKLKFKVLI